MIFEGDLTFPQPTIVGNEAILKVDFRRFE